MIGLTRERARQIAVMAQLLDRERPRDATATRGLLRVSALHMEAEARPGDAEAVHAELAALALWLGLAGVAVR